MSRLAARTTVHLRAQGVAVPDPAPDETAERRPHRRLDGGDLPWGFARGVPSLEELFAAASARGDPADGAAQDAGQDPQSSRPQDRADGSPSPGEAGGQSLYMRRLQDSRAFHCPDATECMAEALGAKDALQGLQARDRAGGAAFRC